jgi:hypothetical protein
VALAVVFLAYGRAVAQDHTTLVVAVDLTQSVAVAGPDHKTEFQKNIDGVTKLLAQVPANSRVTVIGITDRSFAQPDILLSATIPADPGYFGERLKSAQIQLVRVWTARSSKLSPSFPQTDIIGALMLAAEIFKEQDSTGKKTLVVFSDMQETSDLNLESHPTAFNFNRGGRERTGISAANLSGVHVYILGVDGAGKSLSYWQGLREFWAKYFRANGGSLESYTILREPQRVEVPRP